MNHRNGGVCVCHRFLNDLEYHITSGILGTLDVDHKWKQVIAEASKARKYSLSIDEIVSMEQNQKSGPAAAMLLKLAERGMKVQELVAILTALHLEKALSYLYQFVNDLLIIEEHPPDKVFVDQSKPCVLRCRAAGYTSVKYQWFHNNSKLSGQTRPELTINDVSDENVLGKYTCGVYKKCPCGRYWSLFSNVCYLSDEMETPEPTQISLAGQPGLMKPHNRLDADCPPTKYKAKDKIALLIGNCNYRTISPLPAVKNDLAAFRNILKGLNFRVFSFIDLDLEEMINAVHSFTCMLRDGVYGVFYFAGHGFEYGGESYMMPTDCMTGKIDPNESLQVKKLLSMMQECRPALCTLFLDMCRLMSPLPTQCPSCGLQVQDNGGNFVGRGADDGSYCMRCYNPLTYKVATIGHRIRHSDDLIINKAIFYAASSGDVAYEKEDGTQGVFMKSLANCLKYPKTMPELYQCMGREFTKNSAGKFQRPEVEFGILEERTLHDENEYDCHTIEYRHDQFWQVNHNVPDGRTVNYTGGIVFTVDFEEMFSNVLKIEVVLKTLPHGVQIDELQLKFSKEISLLPEVGLIPPYQNKLSKVPEFQCEEEKKVFKLSEIHKLQNELDIQLKLTYKFNERQHSESKPLRLGRPLVSQVWQTLYRDRRR